MYALGEIGLPGGGAAGDADRGGTVCIGWLIGSGVCGFAEERGSP